jgi:PAS domain S-box-containing protein
LSVHDINRPFFDYVGLTEDAFLAGGWSSVIHPDERAENQRRWHVAALEGGVFEQEHRLRAADGTWRWFLSRSVPQLDATGKLVRWFGSAVDIHQRRRNEMRQRRLLAEVQHRAKNILAVVRSLLSRTLETATSLDDFAAHLSGRVSALARTQTALGRTVDGAVSLDELAHQEALAPGGQISDQVSIEGPCVMLTDKVAETLGLALHELTTNALKFGALSEPEGRVKIWWTAAPCEGEPDGTTHLTLNWEESGVEISEPASDHRGFGRELIERGLPYELDARTKLQFLPHGLHCEISVVLKIPPQGGPLMGEAA